MAQLFTLYSVFWYGEFIALADDSGRWRVVLHEYLNDESKPGASKIAGELEFINGRCARKFLDLLSGRAPSAVDLEALREQVEDNYRELKSASRGNGFVSTYNVFV